jgi:N-acetylneuraminic acid mutarotase
MKNFYSNIIIILIALFYTNILLPQTGEFQLTTPMNESREWPAAVLMPDGKVFVTGGLPGSGNAGAGPARISTEMYDPATETWTYKANLIQARGVHKAVLLNNGKVLVVGGQSSSISGMTHYNTGEIYDPSINTFSSVGNNMTEGRAYPIAVLLNDGKVIVSGGENVSGVSNTTDIYDPNTNTFTQVGNMTIARAYFTGTLLDDGRVLVVGGSGADIYDPVSQTFSYVGNMSTTRWNHTATKLNDGRVLITGGYPNNTAEIFDPATNNFSAVIDVMSSVRYRHTATLLDNGKVLITGGVKEVPVELATAEVFDPITESFGEVIPLYNGRFDHESVELIDGRVLITGGAYDGSPGSVAISSCEIFDPNFEPPTPGLVAYYPFNGNANDESGNNNHGTVDGATLISDRFGNPAKAYSFDGQNDKIDFGDVTFLDGESEATIALWINYTEHSGEYDPFITKGPIAQFEGSYTILYTPGGGHLSSHFVEGWETISSAHLAEPLDDGEWYFITVTLENKRVEFYLDGILSTSLQPELNCSQIQNISDPLTVGYNIRGSGENWYKGFIDDIRIYDYAISKAEILELYHEGGWGTNNAISVLTPNGGEVWGMATEQFIIWSSIDIIDVKIEFSSNNGASWELVNESVPSTGIYSWNVPAVHTIQGLIKISDVTDEDIFDISDNVFTIEPVTGMEDENNRLIPDEYSLSQNHPNPFNPTTKIKYGLPNAGLVTIKVYDVLGNEVATIVNEERYAGNYEITWYAEQLPSGIYFYRIQAGSFVETKKMILMK